MGCRILALVLGLGSLWVGTVGSPKPSWGQVSPTWGINVGVPDIPERGHMGFPEDVLIAYAPAQMQEGSSSSYLLHTRFIRSGFIVSQEQWADKNVPIFFSPDSGQMLQHLCRSGSLGSSGGEEVVPCPARARRRRRTRICPCCSDLVRSLP